MAARPKIIKLAKKICGATAMLVKIDENAPEYYVLDCIVTDEMADVGLAMELRKPQTIEQIAKKCGKSVEKTRELAMQLAVAGACVFYSENGVDYYELTVFVPGVMEKVVGNKELCEKYPQIPRAFEHYARERGGLMATKLPVGTGPMRVIPIQSAVDGTSRVAPFEELAELINKNDLIAVADCSCRRSRRLMGEGCGHLEKDMCIQLGKGAEYYIRTGKARRITKEEAFEILRKAEANGLMHQIPNIDGDGNTHAICNCCACSCYSIRNAAMFNAPDMIRSNFVAQSSPDKCVACGQCVENCPMNALQLGQKLCTVKPVQAPKEQITARDHVWGKDKWNVEYRTNRKDVVDTGTAPCKTKCPAHIAVQGYIKLASQGRYKDALALIKKENPFPAVCGRICPHGCESECTRGDIDQPIAIDEIKKFVADRELAGEFRFVPEKMHDYSDKKIAVIGGGPAGLSCAYYLAIDNYSVTVFEKEKKLGGMLTFGVPSFRLEKDVLDAEIDVLRELGVEFRTGVEVGKDVTLDELRAQGYKGFYIAIGAQGGRKLGIEGESAVGVEAGVDFLRRVNLGEKVALRGKVAVIGGGNVAIDVARTAVRCGADEVTIYCLEKRDEMPALEEEIAEAEEEGVKVVNSVGPKSITEKDGKAAGVKFVKCVSVFDKNGKFAPVYDETAVSEVEADNVLVAVGQSIVWGDLLKGSKVELNGNNTAKADGFTYQTAEPDIFVGGDVFTGPKFAITAIAAGKQGAISLHRFVQPGQSLVIGRDRREYVALDKSNVDKDGYDRAPRQKAGHNSANDKTFRDNRLTFTEEQMKKETERCLGCGAVQVNEYMCVGCGMCVTKCNFDAIRLAKRYDGHGTTFEKLPVKMAGYMAKRTGKIIARSIKDAFTIRKD